MSRIARRQLRDGQQRGCSEKPVHQVTIKPFAIGKYPITVREWNECAAAKACTFTATGKDDAPVTNVSWSDAKQFVDLACRRNAESPTGFRARPNGNTRRGAARRPNIGGASSSARHGQLQELHGRGSRRTAGRRSAASSQIRSAFTTWAAASINGSRIAGTRPIRARHRTVRRGVRATAVHMSFGRAHGRTMRAMPARRTATATIPTFAIRPHGFRVALSP